MTSISTYSIYFNVLCHQPNLNLIWIRSFIFRLHFKSSIYQLMSWVQVVGVCYDPVPLLVTKYSVWRVNHGLQHVSAPPIDQQKEEKRQQLGLSLWFLLSSWAGRSVRLPDTQSASRSTSLCTNLLQANKTRYQRMTRSTSPPGIFLLLLSFLLPPSSTTPEQMHQWVSLQLVCGHVGGKVTRAIQEKHSSNFQKELKVE